MKLSYIIVAVFFVLFVRTIEATERHHSHPILPETTTGNNYQSANGIALSISMAQLGCDWGTEDAQGGIGVGNYNNKNAVSIGLCERVNRVMFRGSFGTEGRDHAYGFGMRIHF